MNLVKTLARVAMGVMVARGVGKMLGGGRSRSPSQTTGSGGSGGGLGGLGGLLGGGVSRSGQSNAPSIGRGIGGSDGVGGLSRGNSTSVSDNRRPLGESSSSTGGFGGLLEGITRGDTGPSGSGSGRSGGGLAEILGSVLGGRSAASGDAQRGTSGGLGDLLESLGGGQRSSVNTSDQRTGSTANSGSLGDLLNQAFGGQTASPQPEQNAQAEILLRGMLNAAKSDGKFDTQEQQKVMEHLGDIDQEEMAFVQEEMRTPLDVEALVRSVPRGLEQQVYVMSLLGIELDSQAEAQYLDKLARGLGIEAEQANALHRQVGVPELYG